MSKKLQLKSLERLLIIMDELRDKCSWDKKQTFDSLKPLTIEETYELVDAISENNIDEIKNELGDLLFSIINLSRHLEIDVSEAVNQANHKFVRRFRLMEEEISKGNQEIDNLTSEELEEFWVKIKSHE